MSDILTATITLTDSTVITLGDGAIASGSWSFKKTAGSGGFEMGGAAISSCNFTILDQAGQYNAVDFENADVVAEINGVDYWKGYIKTATQAYNKIVVTAYDKLALADERKISMYSNSGEFPDNPPTTRSDLATFIATNSQFGIGLSGISGLANGSSVIPKMDKDCTFRQAIAYIAEAGGQFAYVDTVNNTLCFAWYDFNSNLYTPANIFGRNLSRDGTTISYVNVITYDGASAQMEPPFSNDGLTVEVSGNPCVTTDTLSSDVSIIESALVGTEFISGTLTVGTDMSLNVGRVIPISHHGRTYGLPVASITYKPNNTMVIGCNDVSNMKMSFKSGSTMNSPGSDYRKTSYQQALDDAITNRNSKLAQALAQGGGQPVGGANILTFNARTPLFDAWGYFYVNGIVFVNNAYTYKVWSAQAKIGGDGEENLYIAKTTKLYVPDVGVQVVIDIPVFLRCSEVISCGPDGIGISPDPAQNIDIPDQDNSTLDITTGNAILRVLGSVDESGTKFNVSRYADLFYTDENRSGSGSSTYHKESAIFSMYPLKYFSQASREIPCTYEVATVNHVSAGTGTTVNNRGAVSVNTESDTDVDDAIDIILS